MRQLSKCTPSGLLKNKKTALSAALHLIPELRFRIDKKMANYPAIAKLIEALNGYQIGLHPNQLDNQKALICSADSAVLAVLSVLYKGHPEGWKERDRYDKFVTTVLLLEDSTKIIDEIFQKEQSYIRMPKKVGSPSNSHKPPLKSKRKAIIDQIVDFYNSPDYQKEIKDAVKWKLRKEVVTDALDELVVLEMSPTPENLSLLSSILTGYLPLFNNAIYHFSDSYIQATKRTIARAIKYSYESGIVSEADCRAIRCTLEHALEAILLEMPHKLGSKP